MNKQDAELLIRGLTCLWDEHYSYVYHKDAEHIKRLVAELRQQFNIEKDKWADF